GGPRGRRPDSSPDRPRAGEAGWGCPESSGSLRGRQTAIDLEHGPQAEGADGADVAGGVALAQLQGRDAAAGGDHEAAQRVAGHGARLQLPGGLAGRLVAVALEVDAGPRVEADVQLVGERVQG